MITKAIIEFRSKFQFQILLEFYRTLEKAEVCDGNGQVKSFEKDHHFSNFQIMVTILFFDD